ncbi:MAG: HEAT repeat domain-containing protein [Planctomycetes bacterium]|nr:HEAT repeat domain-containing protein [Planctomycetota bacterium]
MRQLILLPVLLTLAAGTQADTVLPRAGQAVEGKVTQDDDQLVVVNPFNSGFKEVVWGIEKFEKRMVARVDLAPENPFQAFWKKMGALKAADAAGAAELAKWAKEKKLEPEAKEAAAWALAADPANADARAILGAEADKLLKSSARHNKELAARVADYVALETGERKAAYELMKKDFGVKEPQVYFDRVGRSMGQPKGFRKEVKLTINSEKVTGVYCIYVPEDYDPLRPWPLVIGLHGGGPAGKDGKGVVGNGPDFFPFLDENSRERGYIAACPSAIAAPWSSPENDGLFTGLIQELGILYNVDLTRVYLIGHSMGGYGTWHFGPKYCEKFACIAPASGGGHNGEGKLADNGTGVYVYHSDDDPRCGVDPDREAAKLLKKSRCDFIYTELPSKQHSWPREVVTDTFDFFDRRRLMAKAGKSVAPPRAPRPSFLEKLTAEELKYFPISSTGGGGKNEIKQWLGEVQRGGGNAEKAARKIAESADKSATPTLAAWLLDKKTGSDVKVVCAWTIGELLDAKGITSLAAALSDESLKVRRSAAEALGKIGDPKGGAPLAAAVEALAKVFDSKMQGNAMDLTDWENLQDLNAVYVQSLSLIGDPKTAQPVVTVSIRKILCSKINVDFDRQVQDNPEIARRKAGKIILEALPGFKEPKLKDELKGIRETFAGASDVLEAADAAEAKIGG